MIGAKTRTISLTFLILFAMQAPAQQLAPYRAPRFPGTQIPDLNGIWQAINSANWDIEPHAAGPSPFPALLGSNSLRPYSGYNPNVNVSIANEFSTAAYRIGHTLINDDVLSLDIAGVEQAFSERLHSEP